MYGLIHLYEGDGKGKTTAAVGLSVRCAGNGGSVLFTQFLKDGTSGEISVLKKIPQITVFSATEKFGFTFRMTEEEKKAAVAYYTNYLKEIGQLVRKEHYDLLVLDEAVGACSSGMIKEEELLSFLDHRPDGLEVVLTGRNPSAALRERSDYDSEIRKEKHPFDRGITGRDGIER